MNTVARILRRFFSRGEVDCREIRESGSDFLEGSLPPQKRNSIQAHLDRCGPCRAFIDSLSATIGLLSRLPRTAPPSTLKQSILERTSRQDQGP